MTRATREKAAPKAKQVTIRGVTPELAERLAARARREGVSLNTTVLRILEDALGAGPRRLRLERLQTWTDEELEEQAGYLREQRRIDDALWK